MPSTKNLGKLRITKTIFLLLLLSSALLIATHATKGIKNYLGYCTQVESDSRGMKLTTSQRLEIAVKDYLRRQRAIDLVEIHTIEKSRLRLTDLEQQIQIIPYVSVEHFFEYNQDCCQLTLGLVEGEQFSIWRRAKGVGNGMFEFKHEIRYFDERGQLKKLESRDTFYKVDNCGNARSIYYL